MKQLRKIKNLLIIMGLLVITGCTTLTPIIIKTPSNEQSNRWTELTDLPSFTIEEHSDGCSGGMSASYAKFVQLHNKKTKDKKLPWVECCHIHDKAYYYGGSKEKKVAADETLKNCVNEKQGTSILGGFMQAAVTLGGDPSLHTSYRWGYGEDFRNISKSKNTPLTEICKNVKNPKDSIPEVKSFWTRLNHYYKDKDDRKLVVFMDGTRNTKASNTNVWQLYKKALEQACSDNHSVIPYYVKGLGTDWYDIATGSTKGLGSGKKIRQAYSFLANTYQKGDKVFIFGFSRGAFTARSLNGMIEYAGLLKVDDSLQKNINILYEAYNQPHDGINSFLETLQTKINVAKDKAAMATHKKITVSAIGLFDTVAAVGEKFFDSDPTSLSSGTITYNDPSDHRTDLYALKGFHAMSIDEQRTAFQLLRFRNKTNHLEEVWFAGGHENIGGQNSSVKVEIDQGLSKIPLNWMVKKFEEYKIFPPTEPNSPCKHKGVNCEKGKLWDDFFANHILWEKGRVFRRWPKDDDLVHESVFCRKKIDLGEALHPQREPKSQYNPQNLKGKKYYNTDKKYSRTVKYDCVH